MAAQVVQQEAVPVAEEPLSQPPQPPRELPKFQYLNVGANPPKHLAQSLPRAAGSIVGGAVAGVGTLVAAPILGAKQGGATGFVKGLGFGISAAICFPAVGVVHGVASIGRGLAATPGAIKGNVEGKEYDPVTKKWIHFSLDEDRKVLSEDAEDELKAYLKFVEEEDEKEKKKDDEKTPNGDSSSEEKKAVKETKLYDELGVAPTATEGQIKKAYYKKALLCHPDKNPGDAEAAAKFQTLGDAYRVLSDPAKRETYDLDGMDAVKEDEENAGGVDPATFFAMVFGSEQFEKFVGELRLASAMKEEDRDIDSVEEDFRQRQRRTRLAVTLVDDVLKPFTTGEQGEGRDSPPPLSEEEFATKIRTEIADDLVVSPFGATLVRVIAYIYAFAADKYDGSAVKQGFTRVRDVKHKVSTRIDVASGAARAFSRAKRASQATDNWEAAASQEDDDKSKSVSALTNDGAPLDDAKFAIVSDHHGKDWSLSFYAAEDKALLAYKKLSYTFASVLFRWKKPVDDDDDNLEKNNSVWQPIKTYGTAKSTESIKKVVDQLQATKRRPDSPPTQENGDGGVKGLALTHANLAAVVRENKEAEMAASVMETAWRVTVLDVEATLRDATSKLFRDKSVTDAQKKLRAKALRVVAKVFKQAADDSGHSTVLADVLSSAGGPFANTPDDGGREDDS